VLLAQTTLIVALLVQLARRRRAEDAVRNKQVELRTSYDRIRDLGGRLLSAQESERSRIARELHDDIGQQVALLSIDLEMLRASATSPADGPADEALTRAQALAKSVHDLSHRLHPARLRLVGLVAAIRGLQQEMSRADASITFTHHDVPSTLPPEITLTVFRIVQEALQNALKYSGARHLVVDLRGTPGELIAHHPGRWPRVRRGRSLGQGAGPDQHGRTSGGGRRDAPDRFDAGQRDPPRSHGAAAGRR
jgi:signal transduction histidine kinase